MARCGFCGDSSRAGASNFSRSLIAACVRACVLVSSIQPPAPPSMSILPPHSQILPPSRPDPTLITSMIYACVRVRERASVHQNVCVHANRYARTHAIAIYTRNLCVTMGAVHCVNTRQTAWMLAQKVPPDFHTQRRSYSGPALDPSLTNIYH